MEPTDLIDARFNKLPDATWHELALKCIMNEVDQKDSALPYILMAKTLLTEKGGEISIYGLDDAAYALLAAAKSLTRPRAQDKDIKIGHIRAAARLMFARASHANTRNRTITLGVTLGALAVASDVYKPRTKIASELTQDIQKYVDSLCKDARSAQDWDMALSCIPWLAGAAGSKIRKFTHARLTAFKIPKFPF